MDASGCFSEILWILMLKCCSAWMYTEHCWYYIVTMSTKFGFGFVCHFINTVFRPVLVVNCCFFPLNSRRNYVVSHTHTQTQTEPGNTSSASMFCACMLILAEGLYLGHFGSLSKVQNCWQIRLQGLEQRCKPPTETHKRNSMSQTLNSYCILDQETEHKGAVCNIL